MSSINARWQVRLRIRQALLAAARARLKAHKTTANVMAVKTRKEQVAQALRVLARHPAAAEVAPPVAFTEDSWGWHPGVHDGIDLICEPSAPIYALVDARVVDVRDSGWWGLGAPNDPALKAKGDGIIQLECLVDVGPFRKGMHFAYGHAEGAVVKVGDIVSAGQHLGHAGFANAWHVHFMVNAGGTLRGVGDRDPKPFVDYACGK